MIKVPRLVWILGGAAVLAVVARTASAATGDVNSIVRYWASARQIPVAVLMAWIKRESNFRVREYNPEKSAIARWSCEVAGNPAKWGQNPDFGKAVEVCKRLGAGASVDSVLSSWTFGSYGLMQVSRITAAGHGYGYALPNSGLWDPNTNLKVGTAYIDRLRERLYPGRKQLTETEWSRVRAAYVGGPGVFSNNPSKATEIASQFLGTYKTYA